MDDLEAFCKALSATYADHWNEGYWFDYRVAGFKDEKIAKKYCNAGFTRRAKLAWNYYSAGFKNNANLAWKYYRKFEFYDSSARAAWSYCNAGFKDNLELVSTYERYFHRHGDIAWDYYKVFGNDIESLAAYRGDYDLAAYCFTNLDVEAARNYYNVGFKGPKDARAAAFYYVDAGFGNQRKRGTLRFGNDAETAWNYYTSGFGIEYSDEAWEYYKSRFGKDASLAWKYYKAGFDNAEMAWNYYTSGFVNDVELAAKYYKAGFDNAEIAWKYHNSNFKNDIKLALEYYKAGFDNAEIAWQYHKTDLKDHIKLAGKYYKAGFNSVEMAWKYYTAGFKDDMNLAGRYYKAGFGNDVELAVKYYKAGFRENVELAWDYKNNWDGDLELARKYSKSGLSASEAKNLMLDGITPEMAIIFRNFNVNPADASKFLKKYKLSVEDKDIINKLTKQLDENYKRITVLNPCEHKKVFQWKVAFDGGINRPVILWAERVGFEPLMVNSFYTDKNLTGLKNIFIARFFICPSKPNLFEADNKSNTRKIYELLEKLNIGAPSVMKFNLTEFNKKTKKLHDYLKKTKSEASKKILGYWKKGKRKLPEMFKKKKEITKLLLEALTEVNVE